MPLRFLLLPPDLPAYAVPLGELRLGFFDGESVLTRAPADLARALDDARFALDDRPARWELIERDRLGRVALLRAETDPVACNPVPATSAPVLGRTMRFGDTTVGEDYVCERLLDAALVAAARRRVGKLLVLAAPARGTLLAGRPDALRRAAELAYAEARSRHPLLALSPAPIRPEEAELSLLFP